MRNASTRLKSFGGSLAIGVALFSILSLIPRPTITVTWKGNPSLAANLLAQALSSDIAWSATGKLALSGSTAPTVSSGFGTSPSITTNNGALAFIVNVGTGGSATNGVLTMPTASTGWNCYVNDITAAGAHVAYNTRQTASATTTVTIENQTTSTGAAVAWAASDLVRLICVAY